MVWKKNLFTYYQSFKCFLSSIKVFSAYLDAIGRVVVLSLNTCHVHASSFTVSWPVSSPNKKPHVITWRFARKQLLWCEQWGDDEGLHTWTSAFITAMISVHSRLFNVCQVTNFTFLLNSILFVLVVSSLPGPSLAFGEINLTLCYFSYQLSQWIFYQL